MLIDEALRQFLKQIEEKAKFSISFQGKIDCLWQVSGVFATKYTLFFFPIPHAKHQEGEAKEFIEGAIQ